MSGNNFLDTFIGTKNFLYDEKRFVAVLETSKQELKGVIILEETAYIVDLDDTGPDAPGLNLKLGLLENMTKGFSKRGKGGILVDVEAQNFTRLSIDRAFVPFSSIIGIQKVSEKNCSESTQIILRWLCLLQIYPFRLKINLPIEEFIFKLSKCSDDKIYAVSKKTAIKPKEEIEFSEIKI